MHILLKFNNICFKHKQCMSDAIIFNNKNKIHRIDFHRFMTYLNYVMCMILFTYRTSSVDHKGIYEVKVKNFKLILVPQ